MHTLLGPAPPYVPRNTDYSLDMGLMTSHEDMFWGSGSIGLHLGPCFFSSTQTCQQYADAIIGVGVRESETQGLFLGGLRWQYVNFPKRYSPFWRLFAGTSSISRSTEVGWRPTAGAGLGITTFLHDKVDLRFEVRTGFSDRVYTQAMIGMQIKADRLLQAFALKLRDFGYGTVETAIQATGTAIQATGEGLSGIIEGVSKPFREDEELDGKSGSEK